MGGHVDVREAHPRVLRARGRGPGLQSPYPEHKCELGPAEERLRMFLEQYWGGPTTYSGAAGPPPAAACATPPFPVDTWARETLAAAHARGHGHPASVPAARRHHVGRPSTAPPTPWLNRPG
ncbi:hypothetical protein QJS66_01475 [Kocuria rhizophila]|nr:hypothetical protein QJS66_01475 [Kocuria rhizophila]